jgi:hypothetical protein
MIHSERFNKGRYQISSFLAVAFLCYTFMVLGRGEIVFARCEDIIEANLFRTGKVILTVLA